MDVFKTAERLLSARLVRRLAPRLAQIDEILNARGEAATARRMSLLAFAIRILSAAIAFVSQIVLARFLGAFDYGIYVFVWTLALIVGVLSCLGLDIAVIRFLPQYRAAGAHAEIRGMAFAVRMTAMASATLVAALAIAGLLLFGYVVPSYYLVPLYIGALLLPMIALGAVLDGTSRANGWVVNALTPAYILRPLLILAFIAVVIAAGAGATAPNALLCALAATYLAAVVQYAIVRYRLARHFTSVAMAVRIGTWLRVSLPILLVEGFYFLLTNSDVVVVGLFLQPDKVAVYFAAAKSMALVHFVYFAVKAGAGPRYSELIATGKRDELASAVQETIQWTFWPSLVVGTVVVAAGPFLLSLFGPGFVAGVGIMAVLFAGIMAKAAVGPCETLLTMADQQKICVAVYAVALATNIGLNVALIPLYGIYGAAIATSGAMIAEAVLLHIVVRRRLGIRAVVFAARRNPPLPAHEAR